jgi:hypothetical protein
MNTFKNHFILSCLAFACDAGCDESLAISMVHK